MDAIVYDKVGKEAEKVREALYGIYPQETITDAAIASFDDGADGIPVKALTVGIEPVQGGSGDPSPDNVRPISGWTGVEINDTGINVWDEEWEQGAIEANTGADAGATNSIRTKGYIPVAPQTNYYVKNPVGPTVIVCAYDKNKQFIKNLSYNVGNRVVETSDNRIRYMRVAYVAYGDTYNNDLSINYPATDTEYHHYQGNKISVTFPTEAGDSGTVYGGTLTLNPDRTGTLAVDRAKKIFNGTEELAVAVSGGQGYVMFALGAKNTTVPESGISNILKAVNSEIFQTDWAQHVQNSSAYDRDQIAFRFSSDFQNDNPTETNNMYRAELARLYQAGTPLEVVYMLAEPQTFQLTAEQVSGILSTLYGQNNILADTGNIEKLTYHADLGRYIDSHITTAVANALNA